MDAEVAALVERVLDMELVDLARDPVDLSEIVRGILEGSEGERFIDLAAFLAVQRARSRVVTVRDVLAVLCEEYAEPMFVELVRAFRVFASSSQQQEGELSRTRQSGRANLAHDMSARTLVYLQQRCEILFGPLNLEILQREAAHEGLFHWWCLVKQEMLSKDCG